MDRSFGKQDPRIILRSRLPAEPRSPAIGTIPVDPSDDAGDGGGISQEVSPASRTTDPKSHTPVGVRLAANHRIHHLRFQENHRHRTGWVDNSLPRVPAHTHCATTTALSLRNPMVDPTRTLVIESWKSLPHPISFNSAQYLGEGTWPTIGRRQTGLCYLGNLGFLGISRWPDCGQLSVCK